MLIEVLQPNNHQKKSNFVKIYSVYLDKDIIIQKLSDAKPFLETEYQLNELALFGSYARNEQTNKSDIDIMVSENSKSFRKYTALFHYLQNLFGEYKVQMVSKAAIKPAYFERLKSDLLYV